MKSDSSNQLFAIIKRGTSISLLTKLGAKMAALLMTLVLARNLSLDDYGAFAYVSTCLLFLVIIGVAGLDTASMRFVAQYAEEADAVQKTATFVRWARRRVLLTACVVASIAYFVTVIVGWRQQHLDESLIVAAVLALPLLVLTQFQQFVLRAKRMVGRADIVGQIVRPLVVASLVAIAIISSGPITNTQAMRFLLVGALLSAIAGEYWLRRSLPGVFAIRPNVEQSGLWSKTALPMLWISGSHFLLHQLDILMLGTIAGAVHVAPYAVASRLADVVVFSLLVASGIVAPMISSLYHSGQMQELRQMLRLVGRWVTLIALVAAIAISFGRGALLGLFGTQYVIAQYVLLVLIAGQLVNAFAGPVGFLLSMTGNQSGSAIILGMGVLINVVLNLWLIPDYQEMGAAAATAMTAVFWNASMTILANHRLGLRATPV